MTTQLPVILITEHPAHAGLREALTARGDCRVLTFGGEAFMAPIQGREKELAAEIQQLQPAWLASLNQYLATEPFYLSGQDHTASATKVLKPTLISLAQHYVAWAAAFEAIHRDGPILAVVVHEDVMPSMRVLCALAKSHGIPTLHLPHGVCLSHFPLENFNDRMNTDYVGAQGAHTREWFLQHPDNDPNRIVLVGRPDWDDAYVTQLPEPAVARAALGVPADQQVVGFAGSWAHDLSTFDMGGRHERLFRYVLRGLGALGEPLPAFLVRPHPAHKSVPNCGPEWYARIAAEEGVAISVATCDQETFLGACDLVMSFDSNFMLHALLAGRIALSIPDQQHGMPAVSAYAGVPGIATCAADEGAIAAAMQRALRDPDFRASLAAGRQETLERFNFQNDGQSTQRTVALIDRIIEAARPAEMMSVILAVAFDRDTTLAVLQELISATNSDRTPYEVVLVDLGRADPALEALYASLEGDLRLVHAPAGVTRGEALTLGARAATGNRLVFLEPGAIPVPGWLEALDAALAEADVVGGQLLGPGHVLVRGGYVFRQSGTDLTTANDLMPLAAYAGAPSSARPLQGVRPFQAVYGGALAVLRERFIALGGFDAELAGPVLWLDFGLRASQAGWRVVATSGARFAELKGEALSPREAYVMDERFQERWADVATDDAFTRYVADDCKLLGVNSEQGVFLGVVLTYPGAPEPIPAPGMYQPWHPALLERRDGHQVLPNVDGSNFFMVPETHVLETYDGSLRYNHDVDLDPRGGPGQQADLIGPNKRVLEVGCATGKMTKALGSRGCSVVGVELDAAAAQHATPYAEQLVVGDVETLDLVGMFGAGSFDAILAGDVLEHLKDPEAALKKLRLLLKPDGVLVGCVPNVSHGSVRLALLAGQWRYRRLGLLDRTHIHFFTRWSMLETLRKAGYHTDTMRPVHVPIEGVDLRMPEGVLPEAVLDAIRQDPESEYFQLLFRASPARPVTAARP